MRYRVWLITAIILFAAGIIMGIASPSTIGLPPEYIERLKELSRYLVFGSPLTAMFIFLKNIVALLLTFMLSPLLCIPPLLSLATNGWLIGYVTAGAAQQNSIVYMLFGILPHSIFELPALIIGNAAALNFGSVLLLGLSKKYRPLMAGDLVKSAKLLALAFILLVPVALIETFLTPMLLG
jgi:stage II sporulation protein M